ncbi:hypothetical protein ACX9NE_22755 [Mycobacterium sp. ML4]
MIDEIVCGLRVLTDQHDQLAIAEERDPLPHALEALGSCGRRADPDSRTRAHPGCNSPK